MQSKPGIHSSGHSTGNGHIEAFHHTVEKLICSKYCFASINDAIQVFTRFFDTYNNKRIMKAILHLTPMEMLINYYSGKIGVKLNEKKKQAYYFKEEPKEKSNGPSLEVLFGFFNNKFMKS